MKRRELVAGGQYAYGHQRAIVLTTEPWIEEQRYMGRFGTYGTGVFRPRRHDYDGRNGVAVAVEPHRKDAAWTPAVVQLSQLKRSWAEHQHLMRADTVAQNARRDAEAAAVAKIARLPEYLNAKRVAKYDARGFRAGYDPTRVDVSLETLLQLVEGRRAP